jgi:alkylhydroperoxidase family enzyme
MPAVAAELNVFRALLHRSALAKAFWELPSTLMFKSVLSARIRELVIMRIACVTGSAYEWAQHWQAATAVKIAEADIGGVRDWRSYEGFDGSERAALAAADEVLDSGRISAATWELLGELLPGRDERIELVASIVNWQLFSALLRSIEIPLEEHLAPWPPDGVSPGQ